MSAELLRRAAEVLRRDIGSLPSNLYAHWGTQTQHIYMDGNADTRVAPVTGGPAVAFFQSRPPAIAEYVALMDPLVALALADWLDAFVATVPVILDASPAVAVARAILREEESGRFVTPDITDEGRRVLDAAGAS